MRECRRELGITPEQWRAMPIGDRAEILAHEWYRAKREAYRTHLAELHGGQPESGIDRRKSTHAAMESYMPLPKRKP